MLETFVDEIVFLAPVTCTLSFADGSGCGASFTAGDRIRGTGWPFGSVLGTSLIVKESDGLCDLTYISDTGFRTFLRIPKGILQFGTAVLVEDGEIVG